MTLMHEIPKAPPFSPAPSASRYFLPHDFSPGLVVPYAPRGVVGEPITGPDASIPGSDAPKVGLRWMEEELVPHVNEIVRRLVHMIVTSTESCIDRPQGSWMMQVYLYPISKTPQAKQLL